MNALVKAPLEGEVLSPGALLCVVAAMHPMKPSHELVFLPTGLSVEEIVQRCAEQCQVSRLAKGAHVTIDGQLVPRAMWSRVRVKAGVNVVVRAVPGNGVGNILKSILQIALVVVATAIGGPLGGFLGAALTAGVIFGGTLLLNALFPPAKTSTGDDTKTVYSIAGTRNGIAKWGPIPVLFGKTRVAPMFAAPPYTEFDGDDQFIRMLYVWGQGPISIGELRLGETPLSEFEDVEVQTFEGYPTDGQQTLYPAEVVQDDLSIELSAEDGPFLRTSAEDASEIIIDLVAPGGLIDMQDDGSKKSQSVSGMIRLKLPGTETIVQSQSWTLKGKSNDPIRKSYRFPALGDGQFDVEVSKTSEDFDVGEGGRTTQVLWTALKTFRKSPPIEYSKPLAITALRIRASKQLNGTPDDLNADCTSVGKSWSGSAWVANQPTQWPADHFRMALQGPGNARPVLDLGIDLPTIELWHEACVANCWKFNMLRDFKSSVRETLRDICAAGRAVPIFRDGKWSVAWEEDFAPVIQHFTPRNSRDFTWTQAYRRLPHALRVKFVNETKGYIEDERLVYDDGYSKATATLFEQAEFPGVTDPDLIYRHGRYRIADAHLRPSIYRLTVDFESIVCTRGDRVLVAHDVILRGLFTGRIKSVNGQTILLDEPVHMEAGQSYGLRIRRKDGSSSVYAIVTVEGWTDELTLVGAMPEAGDLFMFGYSGQETGAYRILRINRSGTSDLSAELELVDDAPGINNADTGPIVGEPGVVVPPIPPSQLRPRNLRASQQIVTRGGAAIHVTRLFFDMPFGLDIASFDVIATSDPDLDGQVLERRATTGISELRAEFEDLETGTWTFLVRGILVDGRFSRFSTPFTVFVDASDLPAPFVTDVVLVNGSTATEFVGTDPEIQWVNNFPAYPAAPSGVNPTYAGNLVRVYDVLSGVLLRQDDTTEARYVYALAFNKADNAQYLRAARRLLRFEVAVVDSYGNISPFVPITVNNPPPASITPDVVEGQNQIFVSWVLPIEPDIAGVAVWVSLTPGFDPYTTTPVYEGLGTQTPVPLPGGVDHYLRIGAYDSFGRQDMNISGKLTVQALTSLFDADPPAVPTWAAVNPITSTLDPVTGRVRVFLDWNDNVEADFSVYELQVKEGAGAFISVPTNVSRAELDKLPGTLITAKIRARDRAGNPSNFSAERTHTASTDAAAPAVPTGLTANGGFGGVAWIKVNRNTEADFLYYEFFESTTTTAPLVGTVATFASRGENVTRTGIPDEATRHYWARAVDTSGNKSAWSARVQATTLAAVSLTTEALAGLIDATSFAAGLAGMGVGAVLPVPPFTATTPKTFYRTSDKTVYVQNIAGTGWTNSSDASLVVGQLVAGQIAAGAIGTTQLAANAATIEKLSVVSRSVINSFAQLAPGPVSTFDLEGWTLSLGTGHTAALIAASDRANATVLKIMQSGTAGNPKALTEVPVDPGQTYQFSAFVKTLGSNGYALIRITFLDKNKAGISGPILINQSRADNPTTQPYADVYRALDAVWTFHSTFLMASGSSSETMPVTINAAYAARMPADTAFVRVEFFSVSGGAVQDAYLAAPALRPIGGGQIHAEQIAVETFSAQLAKINTAYITTAHVVTLSAAVLEAGTALAGSITVSNTALSTVASGAALGAQNPATRINAGVTNIDPGRITVFGATTFADWRYGGDLTQIDGGVIGADTVNANSLNIGMRGIKIEGIEFEHNDPVANSVSWTAGFVNYIDDNGVAVRVAVNAGSYAYTGTGPAYLVWVKGSSTIVLNAASAFNPDRVIMAIYKGNRDLIVDYGRTIIDGFGIKTGSITATQLDVVNVRASVLIALSITTAMLQASAVTAAKINTADLAANVAFVNSLTANTAFIANLNADVIRIGQSPNLLPNSDFGANGANGLPIGWVNASSGGGFFGRNLGGWTPPSTDVPYIEQLNAVQGGYIRMQLAKRIPVVPNQRYQASLYVGTHRCNARIYMQFFDVNGASITAPNVAYAGLMGGTILSLFFRMSMFFTAPANAATCNLLIQKDPTTVGQTDSYLFFTRAFFGEALPLQTVPSPWSNGAQTVIAGGAVQTGIITASNGKMTIDLDGGTISIFD